MIDAPFADEVATVRSLAERCAQDASPEVQARAEPLSTAAAQVASALERRTDAVVAELTSYGKFQVQKLTAIDTARRVSYRLAEIYPQDRAHLRSSFRQISKSSRLKTVPAPATMPIAAAAPAAPGVATWAGAEHGRKKLSVKRPALALRWVGGRLLDGDLIREAAPGRCGLTGGRAEWVSIRSRPLWFRCAMK